MIQGRVRRVLGDLDPMFGRERVFFFGDNCFFCCSSRVVSDTCFFGMVRWCGNISTGIAAVVQFYIGDHSTRTLSVSAQVDPLASLAQEQV